MSEASRRRRAVAPKPKKSVALSGVTAGNTALCTVGRTGNDLHYRGYDILDFAEHGEFEEIAYLLVHGKLPDARRARRLQAASSQALRGLPWRVQDVARADPRRRAPDGRACAPRCSVLGTLLPEKRRPQARAGARDIADRLMASLRLDAALLVPLRALRPAHRGGDRRRLHRRALPAPAARQEAVGRCGCAAMHTSLILYAEHEFNASTFTARVIAGTGSDMYSAITGAIGALSGPKHGGANEVAFDIHRPLRQRRRGRGRHRAARGGEAGDHRLRPPRVHDRRPAQPGDQGSRPAPRRRTRAT